jgi:uncharacterized protein YuzE
MKIDYDEDEDTLFICFGNSPIVRDISYGWNVNVGMSKNGIGQITVLDAKADGILPLQIRENLLEVIQN